MSRQMKEMTGDEDQRYVNREDHDAARNWFERQARAHDKRWTREDRRQNLRKLTRLINGLDLKVKTK